MRPELARLPTGTGGREQESALELALRVGTKQASVLNAGPVTEIALEQAQGQGQGQGQRQGEGQGQGQGQDLATQRAQVLLERVRAWEHALGQEMAQ